MLGINRADLLLTGYLAPNTPGGGFRAASPDDTLLDETSSFSGSRTHPPTLALSLPFNVSISRDQNTLYMNGHPILTIQDTGAGKINVRCESGEVEVRYTQFEDPEGPIWEFDQKKNGVTITPRLEQHGAVELYQNELVYVRINDATIAFRTNDGSYLGLEILSPADYTDYVRDMQSRFTHVHKERLLNLSDISLDKTNPTIIGSDPALKEAKGITFGRDEDGVSEAHLGFWREGWNNIYFFCYDVVPGQTRTWTTDNMGNYYPMTYQTPVLLDNTTGVIRVGRRVLNITAGRVASEIDLLEVNRPDISDDGRTLKVGGTPYVQLQPNGIRIMRVPGDPVFIWMKVPGMSQEYTLADCDPTYLNNLLAHEPGTEIFIGSTPNRQDPTVIGYRVIQAPTSDWTYNLKFERIEEDIAATALVSAMGGPSIEATLAEGVFTVRVASDNSAPFVRKQTAPLRPARPKNTSPDPSFQMMRAAIPPEVQAAYPAHPEYTTEIAPVDFNAIAQRNEEIRIARTPVTFDWRHPIDSLRAWWRCRQLRKKHDIPEGDWIETPRANLPDGR